MHRKPWLLLFSLLMVLGCGRNRIKLEGNPSREIRLNQIGFYPQAIKRAVVPARAAARNFEILHRDGREVVFTGELSAPEYWELSADTIQVADFSSFNEEGEYHLMVEGIGYSYPFRISKNVLRAVHLGSVKALYYQRAGMDLAAPYAGAWARSMGHADEKVMHHPSSGRDSGYLASPKGWYDAGDYNKYVVNGAFSLGQYFLLWEWYPEFLKDATLNLPESGNGQSDYLDELKYEMDWLLSMQDTDGGLFHKVSTLAFEGMVMPSEAVSQRLVIGKGTAASLNFAAAAAQAYRIYRQTDLLYANKCLEAAIKAYFWAQENPYAYFQNPAGVTTGEYGDKNFRDEWFWANAELYNATGDSSYLDELKTRRLSYEFVPGESWTAFMRFLGVFSLLHHLKPEPDGLYASLKNGILKSADSLLVKSDNLPYFQPIEEFHWGSNSDVLNAAMIFAAAYRLQNRPEYLRAVQQAMDYILGMNAVGYCFVTGFGSRSPMFIHHRPSAADKVAAPVPGLLSGGPNSSRQDAENGVRYPEDPPPMKSWVDQEASYASNEICLNWNAPLSFILGFLEQESK